MNTYLDHIIWACKDLDAGATRFEELTGVRPQFGGVHASGLTHNALVSLGGRCYLEILAPVSAPTVDDDPWCRFAHESREPRLMTYCMRSPTPLAELVATAERLGGRQAVVAANGRRTPGGEQLEWLWTAPAFDSYGNAFPFFIDWLDSPHPSQSLAAARPADTLRLARFAVGHPDAEGLRRSLSQLGLVVETFAAVDTRFTVVLEAPVGTVSL